MVRVLGGRAWFEIGHVKVGERVVDEAVHGPRLAEHVLVHQPRDEIRREGDHKGLEKGKRQTGTLSSGYLNQKCSLGQLPSHKTTKRGNDEKVQLSGHCRE